MRLRRWSGARGISRPLPPRRVALRGVATLAPIGRRSRRRTWLTRAFRAHAKNEPPVARYRERRRSADSWWIGAPRDALLRFDDSPEVWALSAARGPRGDIIYSNDLGRADAADDQLGGMTVFTPGRPGGAAASAIGRRRRSSLLSLGPAVLYQGLIQASVRATRAAHHLIGFERLTPIRLRPA